MLDPYLPEDDDIAREACRAYARTINTLDVTHVEPWLHKDVMYASQQVFSEIRGKRRYVAYLRGKLQTIRKKGSLIRAEIAYSPLGANPCVILAQWAEENWDHSVLFEMEDGKIKRIDMCIVPDPSECRRTGERPE